MEEVKVQIAKVETALDYHLKECSQNWTKVESFMGKVITTVITAAGIIIGSLGSALGYVVYHTH